jgi:hypothetical protein
VVFSVRCGSSSKWPEHSVACNKSDETYRNEVLPHDVQRQAISTVRDVEDRLKGVLSALVTNWVWVIVACFIGVSQVNSIMYSSISVC